MNIDKAVLLTQERLANEGRTMEDLLKQFRATISNNLIGSAGWKSVLERANRLPIAMGAHPFFFEIPMHSEETAAKLFVALASGTRSATEFLQRTSDDRNFEAVHAVSHLCGQIEAENSPLRNIVGRKMMLKYNTMRDADGSDRLLPGIFLKPDPFPVAGAAGRASDVCLIAGALASAMGRQISNSQLDRVRQIYLASPEDTRIDSFGISPSHTQTLQFAVLGFKSRQAIRDYLVNAGWSGRLSAVDAIIARFEKHVEIARIGLNIDVSAEGFEPRLGMMLIVKQRHAKGPRYWIDGLTDWDPILSALRLEELAVPCKSEALANWASKPSKLLANSGYFVQLRGIHHIKLVFDGCELTKVNAFLYMALSAVSGNNGRSALH